MADEVAAAGGFEDTRNFRQGFPVIRVRKDHFYQNRVCARVGKRESFGAAGYRIGSAAELLPVLRTALAADTVSVIACPVDYSANLELIESLGDLDEPLS